MARISRKNKEDTPVIIQDTGIQVYKTALYVRLSVEDNGKEDGSSLSNQLALLEDYIATRPYLSKEAVFIDNGYTGTDFHRPEWTRLLDEVKAGKINCIVVKDLSRLGRNYIETGDFIEKVCPFLNLRLIAVNDSYDTASLDAGSELGASLKNIINDYYAKDISRKSSSALKAKRLRGDYVGNYAPHGYLKDPTDKNKLIIDPESAPVIQYIFELRAAGDGFSTITRKLNAEDIPSPGRLRFERGIITNNNKKGTGLRWNRHVTSDILRNVAYIGHLAQGRSSSSYHQGIPFHWVKEADWDVATNTHEPIISMELWERAQAVNQKRTADYQANHGKYSHLPAVNNIYGKKLVCADCGAVIKLVRSIGRGGTKAYFNFKCPTQIEHGDSGCPKKNILQSDLDTAVLESIKLQMRLFTDQQVLLKVLIEKKRRQSKARPQAERTTYLKQELKRKQNLCTSLYTDMKEGILTNEEYQYAKEKYGQEIASIQQELLELQSIKDEATELVFSHHHWDGLVQRYMDADALTTEMVEAFIEKVALFADNQIAITFRYSNEFESLLEACRQLQREVA